MFIFFMLLILISYVAYYKFSNRVYADKMYSLGKRYDKKKQTDILNNFNKLEPIDQTNQYLIFLDEAKEMEKKK